MWLSSYVNIELGEGGGGGARIEIVSILINQLRRARVSCVQNFNVSQQVLSMIVDHKYQNNLF